MGKTALIVIDIQNDITKHYREIIDSLNQAIKWAADQNMEVVYIKHNNLSAGTRTFKPDTKGSQLVPELHVVSDHIFVKTKSNALTSKEFSDFIQENAIQELDKNINLELMENPQVLEIVGANLSYTKTKGDKEDEFICAPCWNFLLKGDSIGAIISINAIDGTFARIIYVPFGV